MAFEWEYDWHSVRGQPGNYIYKITGLGYARLRWSEAKQVYEVAVYLCGYMYKSVRFFTQDELAEGKLHAQKFAASHIRKLTETALKHLDGAE